MPHLLPSERFRTSLKEAWATAFRDLGQRITGSFVRQASHQRALAYLQGLMSLVERKNGTRKRVDQVVHGLAREDWQELSAGTGSKGPRLFAWARALNSRHQRSASGSIVCWCAEAWTKERDLLRWPMCWFLLPLAHL